ncbi:hypothetical protein AMD27_17320 (plasmid) [Acinetobacter sp. TGL-Y2]|uniref:hypothetical protein n=1 Tax=Acinetobacter sp. TGL-Y2 TaxID=1407071 RepID=UPI0007A6564E|nr:hypothetical protein [Acinetobacter sp. TGL-Y2]AMW80678.1 hypothetical protein AMD27_17320 [Acinetobacter sp. TGL-Y2]
MTIFSDKEDIYIKPFKQTEFSKTIDKLVFLSLFTIGIIVFLCILDIFYLDYNIGKKLFYFNEPYLMIFTVASILISGIGVWNGTFERNKLSENNTFELINDLRGNKVKNTILMIIKDNGKITKKELINLSTEMKNELKELQENAFQEMINLEKTMALIKELEWDLLVIRGNLARI